MVDRTRLELVTSALRTPVAARGISLVRRHVGDARPADVPVSSSRANPHSSAPVRGTDGHNDGHIRSDT
jgi:hypothetical protein